MATPDDIAALHALMEAAIAGPLAAFLTPAQVEASRLIMGVDTQDDRGGAPVPLVRMGRLI